MIYLISDPHGGHRTAGIEQYLRDSSKGDICIVLGDLGLNFAEHEHIYKEFTENFLKTDKKFAFIDGNHENYDYIYSFPTEKWHGGEVHRLTPNIVHLMRGYIFDIENKSFFVMGGCRSSNKWKERELWYREEIPTHEEIERGYKNLEKHGRKVDYILTHKYFCDEKRDPKEEEMYNLNRFIDDNVEYKLWFSGHFHTNGEFDEKHKMIYDVPYLIK